MTRAPRLRIMPRLGLVACGSLVAVTGCAAATVRAESGTLRLSASDSSALVYLDDALVGRAGDLARRPLRVPVGEHRLTLRGDGKLDAYREVTIHAGESRALAVTLRPDLDAEDAAAARGPTR